MHAKVCVLVDVCVRVCVCVSTITAMCTLPISLWLVKQPAGVEEAQLGGLVDVVVDLGL
jgi:hypothetical protein